MGRYTISLDQLEVGRKAKVVLIDIMGLQKKRLRDLGLIQGTEILCVNKAPFGGTVAYDIRGAVYALRNEDTMKIIVEMDDTGCNIGRD